MNHPQPVWTRATSPACR